MLDIFLTTLPHDTFAVVLLLMCSLVIVNKAHLNKDEKIPLEALPIIFCTFCTSFPGKEFFKSQPKNGFAHMAPSIAACFLESPV